MQMYCFLVLVASVNSGQPGVPGGCLGMDTALDVSHGNKIGGDGIVIPSWYSLK